MFRNSCMTIVLLTILFLGVVNAQSTITIYSSGVNSIVRYKDAQNQNTFQYTSSYQIGRKDGSNGYYSGSTEDIYRSQHSFSLSSIPSNATLSQVKLIYFVSGSSSYQFKITQTSGSQSWGNLWGEIGTASAMESNINYGSSSRISSSLLSAVNSARSSGVIYLGALSQNEDTNLTEATVELRLEVTYTVQVNITAQNNFGGGTIKVGVNASATQRTSPYPFTAIVGNTVNLEAQEQSSGGYNMIWNDTEAPANLSDWVKIASTGTRTQKSTSISYGFTAADNDNNSTYEAGLRKVCNVTFQNSMPEGGSNFGTITVDGTSYSVTKVSEKVEGNSVSFWAETNQPVINGIQPFFYKWAEDGSTTNPGTVTINTHKSYTAIFKGKPSTSNRNLRFNDGYFGDNILLTWNTPSSSNVSECRIYRKVRINGVMGSEVLIASVSSSTTSYIDYDYVVSSNTTTQLFYDVRYVYNGTLPDATQYTIESDPNFQNIYGEISFNTFEDREIATVINELPTQYKIDNYPNPFNPSTTINYQLPESGFVTVKVFDVLGKEVALLVNDNKSAGYYHVNFDGSKLTSGVYIYTIQVNGITQSKKMLLAK